MKGIKLVFIVLLIIVSGCRSAEPAEETLFQYKDSYIGDNGAVGAILRMLPGSTELKSLSLQTKSEPYGLTAYYSKALPEEEQRETFLFNATFLFTLIQNAEVVSADYDGEVLSVTRDELQAWYGENLFEAASEDELIDLAQPKLEDSEQVNQFFENQTGVNKRD
ncbi:DUF4825 domain-containing protein [Alkalihalobacillus sp. CinArs1]|uniref:DUF4825 domain-containing protein n=1 Tax=Alkalihalobacillus sp. CinArs1 TaxID=2995314 RepID=UPI0022DE0573|nr:DUF4825 domain-containing protein [Alkalihalobacillus sp. CinArs1]